MKATLQLKTNIDDLLKRNGRTRRELAIRVLGTTDLQRADSWISKIFGKAGYHTREIQTKYLDDIADYFGLDVFQLFQPGTSEKTERRSGHDRRSGKERRLDRRTKRTRATVPPVVELTLLEREILDDLRKLQYRDFEHVRGWIAMAKLGPLLRRGAAPDITPPPVPSEAMTKRRRRRGERSET